MPAKVTTDFSITVRFGVPIGPLISISTLSTYFATLGDKYAIAYEQKQGLDSGHYQCALITRSETRQDKLQARVINALKELTNFKWTEENVKYAVKVKAHNDILCLVGGYCTKDDIAPLIVGFTEDDLKGTKERYEEACDNKLKRAPITKTALIPLLREYYQKYWEICAEDCEKMRAHETKTALQKFQFLESLILGEGYDLSDVLSGPRRNYIIKNFDQYFDPKNCMQLSEQYFISHA